MGVRRTLAGPLLALALSSLACRSTSPSGATTTDPLPTPSAPPSVPTIPTSPVPSNPTSPTPSITPTPSAPVTAEDRASDARGDRAFAAKLYAAVAKGSAGNVFVSPASARAALAMAAAGARGDTARELGAVLGLGPRSHDVAAVVASEWAALATPSRNDEWMRAQAIVLRAANRLFSQRGRAFEPNFVELTKGRYGAPIEGVDFKGDEAAARKAINAWVEEQTEHRIQNLLTGPLDPETKLALVNAIYFKASWNDPFPTERTKPEPFFVPGGQKVVPMMNGKAKRRFLDTADAHVVELRYGAYGRNDVVMHVVVPKAKDGLAALETKIGDAQLAAWVPSTEADVELSMPKFHIESTLELSRAVADLGAPSAFAFGKADFSGIDGTRELFLGLVVQKTFVDVDEKGTEAAAATAVMAVAGGPPPPPPKPVVVRADRPFLFLIRDVVRDRVLFMGRVVDPTAR